MHFCILSNFLQMHAPEYKYDVDGFLANTLHCIFLKKKIFSSIHDAFVHYISQAERGQ